MDSWFHFMDKSMDNGSNLVPIFTNTSTRLVTGVGWIIWHVIVWQRQKSVIQNDKKRRSVVFSYWFRMELRKQFSATIQNYMLYCYAHFTWSVTVARGLITLELGVVDLYFKFSEWYYVCVSPVPAIWSKLELNFITVREIYSTNDFIKFTCSLPRSRITCYIATPTLPEVWL